MSLKNYFTLLVLVLGAANLTVADTIQLKDKAAVTGIILAEKPDAVVVDVGYTVLVVPRSFIGGSSLQLALRQSLDLQSEQRRLQASGYRAVPQVQEPGEFAVRGALLDIFPMGSSEPYRIELFDRDIESIRSFDPENQRSLHKIEKVDLLPAREFPLTEESVKAFRNKLRERFPIDSAMLAILADFVPSGVGNALGRNAGGNSLDNTLRIRRITPTEWVLCDIRIVGVHGGFAHGAMHLFAQSGDLMATASQSLIVRVRESPTDR